MEKAIKWSYWSEKEVEELLGLVREDNVLGTLDGKPKRNNVVYPLGRGSRRNPKFYDGIFLKYLILRAIRKHNRYAVDCFYFEQVLSGHLDKMYCLRLHSPQYENICGLYFYVLQRHRQQRGTLRRKGACFGMCGVSRWHNSKNDFFDIRRFSWKNAFVF